MMQCRVCQASCSIFLDMSHIPFSVTSDAQIVHKGVTLYRCKECMLIQKESSESLQKSYFQGFISHPLGDGEEQVKFVDGMPYPRSELIIRAIEEQMHKQGTLIDLGTGSGSFLKSFQKFFPSWTLYAQDIQDNSRKKLEQIVPKEHIFIQDIQSIKQKFDCISLVHLLGHIVELRTFLKELHALSKKDTQFIIQTPDLCRGFFDIVIIDQITHFSQETLQETLATEFQNISFIPTVHKELTALINMSTPTKQVEHTHRNIEEIRNSFKKFIEFLHTSKECYTILGCAPASSYIGAILANRIISFVDEDETKIGKTHMNKTIKSFKNIDKNHKVILPFLDSDSVCSIKSRHPDITFLSFMDM